MSDKKDLFRKVKAGDRIRLTYDVEVIKHDDDSDFIAIEDANGGRVFLKDLPNWVSVKVIRRGPPLQVGERVRRDDHTGEIKEIRPDGDVAVVLWDDGYEGLALIDQLSRILEQMETA